MEFSFLCCVIQWQRRRRRSASAVGTELAHKGSICKEKNGRRQSYTLIWNFIWGLIAMSLWYVFSKHVMYFLFNETSKRYNKMVLFLCFIQGSLWDLFNVYSNFPHESGYALETWITMLLLMSIYFPSPSLLIPYNHSSCTSRSHSTNYFTFTGIITIAINIYHWNREFSCNTDKCNRV